MPYNVKKISVKQADGTYITEDIGVDYSNVDGLDTEAVAFKAKKDLQGNDITGFFRDGSLNGSNLVLARGSGSDPKSIAMGMQGATSGANGTAGLVPAPAIGDQTKFLRGDGTWQETTHPVTSVFGRTGAVTAQTGDYDASKISAGTFDGETMKVKGSTAYTTAKIINTIVTDTAPTAGASAGDIPNGTQIIVYE